jgi:FMN reductase
MTERTLAVITGGLRQPSSSRLLADKLAAAAGEELTRLGVTPKIEVIELRDHAHEITDNLLTGFAGGAFAKVVETVAGADGLVAVSPIFTASYSGLFKSFVDVLDNDLLVAKPVLLAATGGTARHALVIDDQMRPLFAYMRALTLPTSVYAAPEDWGATDLGERIERAARELVVMLRAGVEAQIADKTWSSYQHQFAGNATRADRSVADVDFDSPLMRLAAGGTMAP